MKSDDRVDKLNPYYTEKYAIMRIDQVDSKLKYLPDNFIRLNHAWGIKKISQFIRLYVNNYKY